MVAAGWPTAAHPERVPGRSAAALVAGGVSASWPGVVESVPQARDWARRVLAGHPASDNVELLITELAANAVAHTRSGEPGGVIAAAIRVLGAWVVVVVTDQGPPEVPLMPGDPEVLGELAEHGRGLVLVDCLADDWGTAPDRAGRSVWFRCGGVR